MPIKTSETHPLRIDIVPLQNHPGRIGMTLCPGKRQELGLSGHWQRDLHADLNRIRQTEATILVSLVEEHEFRLLGVEALGEEAIGRGLRWVHLPIRDRSIPDAAFEQRWVQAGEELRQHLRDGKLIVLHCMGGLGRTGTIAARLLVELGEDPVQAIRRVREARPGTLETEEQERYVRECRWRRCDGSV